MEKRLCERCKRDVNGKIELSYIDGEISIICENCWTKKELHTHLNDNFYEIEVDKKGNPISCYGCKWDFDNDINEVSCVFEQKCSDCCECWKN